MGGTKRIEVEYRTSGSLRQRADNEDCDRIVIEVVDEEISVAELIRRTVREQIRVLSARGELTGDQVRGALARRYLSPLDEGFRNGGTGVEPEREEERALRAFGRGDFVVFVDGRQAEAAEELLNLKERISVMFLRLTPLVGG
ncbi:MAG: hypothetical protein AAF517_22470 [Planctomycetota bacterium]